jgi:hypothetical protein
MAGAKALVHIGGVFGTTEVVHCYKASVSFPQGGKAALLRTRGEQVFRGLSEWEIDSGFAYAI